MHAVCRHCRRNKVNRPRGMCFRCYYTPGVKDRYPSTSKYANRGLGYGRWSSPPAPFPTEFAPGTPEKVAVLEERARLGVSLWHPRDADWGGKRSVVQPLVEVNCNAEAG